MMAREVVVLVLWLFYVAAIKCGKLPISVTPCSSSSSEFENCVLLEAQKFLPLFSMGIPELNVPSSDPMRIDALSMDNAGLQLAITNATLTGSKSTKLKKFNIDFAKNKGTIEYNSDIKLVGKYKLDGRIIILPVRGDGDFLMDIRNLHSKVTFHFEILKAGKGKRYIKLGSHKINYEVLGRTYFDFKNLFNGNKLLSDTTLTFVNENWKIIMNEIAPPAIHKVTAIQMSYIGHFFDNVPLDDLIAP